MTRCNCPQCQPVNAKKHTGALLANMVNLRLLTREKAGVFSRPNESSSATAEKGATNAR